MPTSIDNLLIALLVALAPDQESPMGERLADSFQFAAPPAMRPESTDPAGAAAACRQFADAEARRKCEIRLGRTPSGSAETSTAHPETVFWMTPVEPGMPFKFKVDPQR